MYYGTIEPDHAALRRMLENVKPTDAAVACKRLLVTGNPAAAIVEVAATEGVDLIVMGTHGRTGLARLVMGSIAEAVLRGAPCPVLVCKSPARKAA